jgi:hypothetical protein
VRVETVPVALATYENASTTPTVSVSSEDSVVWSPMSTVEALDTTTVIEADDVELFEVSVAFAMTVKVPGPVFHVQLHGLEFATQSVLPAEVNET